MELSDAERGEYFHRSYAAIDGLWFMKVEERHGFEEALRLDEAVWRVLPKIQARTLKRLLCIKEGLDGLEQALSARLEMEGFSFEIKRQDGGLEVLVESCPWHQIMLKSGRGHLSERVSEIICRVENQAWAKEFSSGESEEIGFERFERLCMGECRCRMLFFINGSSAVDCDGGSDCASDAGSDGHCDGDCKTG